MITMTKKRIVENDYERPRSSAGRSPPPLASSIRDTPPISQPKATASPRPDIATCQSRRSKAHPGPHGCVRLEAKQKV